LHKVSLSHQQIFPNAAEMTFKLILLKQDFQESIICDLVCMINPFL
jgi:hypothetical protein